jgi:pimeloyl-ACP methyl ester carboxylesterase
MLRVIRRRRCREVLRSIGTAIGTALVTALLGGCALWRPSVVPMRVLAEPAHCAAPVDTLIVMLPGSYSVPEEFQREGFVKILRARHLAADLVLVDAHVGYYRNRSIVDRLAEDVIGPARARGYGHVWLAGISIGAVGAMLYADAHPADVDGVVLIAP